MNKKDKQFNIKERNLKGGPIIFIVIAVILLIIVSANYFPFLEKQLFEERKNHIMEFTDKASEIVDSVIEYSWQQVSACEYVIKSRELVSEEDLLEMLASMSDFIDETNSLVLAIDKNANYYSSDHSNGRWTQTELLTSKTDSRQQIVAEIPHKNNESYFVFIERLKAPVEIGANKAVITHLAIAVDIQVMREKISVKGFGDKCYTYLINKDGKRLYKYTYTDNFIEGYNVLSAVENFSIINGGTYDNFLYQLERGKNTALEFE